MELWGLVGEGSMKDGGEKNSYFSLLFSTSSAIVYIICVAVMQFAILYSIGPLLWFV